jgi:hypothetical protein
MCHVIITKVIPFNIFFIYKFNDTTLVVCYLCYADQTKGQWNIEKCVRKLNGDEGSMCWCL